MWACLAVHKLFLEEASNPGMYRTSSPHDQNCRSTAVLSRMGCLELTSKRCHESCSEDSLLVALKQEKMHKQHSCGDTSLAADRPVHVSVSRKRAMTDGEHVAPQVQLSHSSVCATRLPHEGAYSGYGDLGKPPRDPPDDGGESLGVRDAAQAGDGQRPLSSQTPRCHPSRQGSQGKKDVEKNRVCMNLRTS